MLAKVISASTFGLEAKRITVEVDVARRGFPTFKIVGLPHKTVAESKERVRTAVRNAGFKFPSAKIVVNLAPADLPKKGSLFDVPIALGILAASGEVPVSAFEDSLFVGQLSLDGSVAPVQGILPIIMYTQTLGVQRVFFPHKNRHELQRAGNVELYAIQSLQQLVFFLRNKAEIKTFVPRVRSCPPAKINSDFSDVRGQPHAKRALEIAIAGGHSVLFRGPPGVGKTLLAHAAESILPDLTDKQKIEVLTIASVSEDMQDGAACLQRFRAPHHSITKAGLIGGGYPPQPGEITKAHYGILFLDELPEFSQKLIDALRQPMDSGKITLARAGQSVTYPAKFILLAAANPCPCGYFGHLEKECVCSQQSISRYTHKISGPILDRFDMCLMLQGLAIQHLEIQRGAHQQQVRDGLEENNLNIRPRIMAARDIQYKRYKNELTNANLHHSEFKNHIQISIEAENILQSAYTKLSLSARAYHKIIKVSRTIADLAGEKEIGKNAIIEALSYR
jgi:magnesium chelatase family protein